MENPYLNHEEGHHEFPQNGINQGYNNNPFESKSKPGIFGSGTNEFLTGALIGVAATYILTNKNAQEALFKGIVKVGKIFGAGIEELKERYEDIKAEVEAEK